MKKQQTPSQKKIFRFQPTGTVVALCVVALVVCAAAIAVSVYRMVRNGGIHGFNDVLKFPFLIAVALFGAILVVALLIRADYVVDDRYLTSRFGLVKSKCAVKDVTSVVLDTETNKLTVYMGEAFSVISVQPKWNEEFVRALLKVNPDIDYSYTVTENKPEKPEKRK